MALKDKVKQLREERGWTQAELARRSGLSRGYIANLEGSKVVHRPSAIAMLKLGIDMRTLQRLLGHSTLTMTLKYVESVDSEQAIERCKEISPVDNIK